MGQDQQQATEENSKADDSRLRSAEESIFEHQPAKRQQLDQSAMKNLASSSLGLSTLPVERRQDISQNQKMPHEMLSQFENLHSLHNNMTNPNPNLTQYSSTVNESKVATTVNSGDDQASLLKKINKILDENTALKKHVEICQKIIEIYQNNMNVNPSSNPLAKDSTTFKH